MGEEVTQLKGKRHSPEQIVCKPREATGSKLRVLTSTRSAATWGSRCRTKPALAGAYRAIRPEEVVG